MKQSIGRTPVGHSTPNFTYLLRLHFITFFFFYGLLILTFDYLHDLTLYAVNLTASDERYLYSSYKRTNEPEI